MNMLELRMVKMKVEICKDSNRHYTTDAITSNIYLIKPKNGGDIYKINKVAGKYHAIMVDWSVNTGLIFTDDYEYTTLHEVLSAAISYGFDVEMFTTVRGMTGYLNENY